MPTVGLHFQLLQKGGEERYVWDAANNRRNSRESLRSALPSRPRNVTGRSRTTLARGKETVERNIFRIVEWRA
jgi:hypothetical protein